MPDGRCGQRPVGRTRSRQSGAGHHQHDQGDRGDSATAQHTLDGFKETAKIFEQGRKYYDALKAVHDVVKGGVKVKKSIEMVADISEIYVRNYQKMLGDPNIHAGRAVNHLVRVRQAAERECGHPARPEERGERDGDVALGRRAAGYHRPELQAAAGVPQPRAVLHGQEHLGELPAAKKKRTPTGWWLSTGMRKTVTGESGNI